MPGNKIFSIAEPYLKTPIGGHAQETLGNTMLYAKQQYEG